MTYKLKYREEYEMKDSGVEWLGKIPKTWNVSKLKFVIKDFITGGTPSSSNQNYYTEFSQGIPWVSISDMSSDRVVSKTKSSLTQSGLRSKNLRVLNKGTLIYSIFATLGKVSELYIEATTNQAILGLINNQLLVNNKYLKYWLINLERNLKLYSSANTQENLNTEKVKNFKFLQPDTLEKQHKIANFLDIKTSKFDSIISKKELLIEKLEEAKKSLISEVVTGKVKIVDGELVDREAHEMKDSGVEWLGLIPKDWEVKRLKYLSENYPSNVDKKSYSGEKQVSLCNYVDVYYNDFITQNLEFMKATASRAQINKFGLKKGNILLTKDSESPDDIAIPSYVNESINNLVCGYHLMIIKPFKYYVSKYIFYQFRTTGIKNYFATVSNGITRYGIGIGGFNNLLVTLPKAEEQDKIASFLDMKTSEFDSIINTNKTQIKKLQEAKQSLISEAVTGKIDLRDWEIEEG